MRRYLIWWFSGNTCKQGKGILDGDMRVICVFRISIRGIVSIHLGYFHFGCYMYWLCQLGMQSLNSLAHLKESVYVLLGPLVKWNELTSLTSPRSIFQVEAAKIQLVERFVEHCYLQDEIKSNQWRLVTQSLMQPCIYPSPGRCVNLSQATLKSPFGRASDCGCDCIFLNFILCYM